MARKKTGKQATKPPPKCKAILLCDTVIVDAISQKPTMVGIFGGFNVPGFPGYTSPCNAFLQLTDGIGTYRITVEVRDLRDDLVVGRGEIAELVFQERAAKHNLIIPVPPMQLQHDGLYDFVVLADGQEIDRQQFGARGPGGPQDATNQPEPPEVE
ncbi:MAG: DUF6941 family protein [Gemmataceae bacterium]